MSGDTTSLIPNYVPPGYKTINLLLTVRDVHKALEFYNRAFGAEVVMKLESPEGIIEHAEVKISDTVIMLAEENSADQQSPLSLGGTSVTIQIYTGDVDAMCEDAVKAGCQLITPVKHTFYGDKACRVQDPFGHQWILSTNEERLSAREVLKRYHDLTSKK